MFDPHSPTPDYGELCDALRCRTTEWLGTRRDWLVREQRRLHLEELAVLRVLDERGQIDDSLAQADGVSIRQVRATLATARALEDLPEIAAVAASGELSSEQLTEVVKVAEPGNTEDDRCWAAQASSWSPQDLAQEARLKRTPTVDESRARRAAHRFNFWDRPHAGMIAVGGELADIDGVFVRNVFDHMVDRMRPAKGESWASRPQRYADALVALCRNYADVECVNAPAPLLIVEVPMQGPATVAGIPLPDPMIERLRAQAKIEPVLVDADRSPVAVGRIESVLSEKTKRVVRQRDGKCRYPGCDRRTALEVHHLWPRSWGGSDKIWNLAAVCCVHHAQLVPHGDVLLLGNPNNPAGLSLVHRDDLPGLAQLAAEHAAANAA